MIPGFVMAQRLKLGSTGGAFRYWRVLISANNGDPTYMTVAEVELRASAGGANLATVQANMTSDSYFVPYGPNRLVDASYASVWIVTGAYPHWFKYAFGSPVVIAELAMSTNTANRAPKDFIIQGSNDNSTWTNVKSHSGATGWTAGATFRTFSAVP